MTCSQHAHLLIENLFPGGAASGPWGGGYRLEVTITLTPHPNPIGLQAASVRAGTCQDLGEVEYQLSGIVKGDSVTTLDAKGGVFFDGNHAVQSTRSMRIHPQAWYVTTCLSAREFPGTD